MSDSSKITKKTTKQLIAEIEESYKMLMTKLNEMIESAEE